MVGPPFYLFYLFPFAPDPAERVYITDMTAGNRARVRSTAPMEFFWPVVGTPWFLRLRRISLANVTTPDRIHWRYYRGCRLHPTLVTDRQRSLATWFCS
jgi:hypothetical protein